MLTSSWDGQPFGQNRHGRKRGGGCCDPFWGELGAHLTQCGLGWGPPPYQVASWSIQPFGNNTHEPKSSGGAVLLLGGAGSPSNTIHNRDGPKIGGLSPLAPHLTVWPGPRRTSIPSGNWSIQPFGHNTLAGKWGCCAPFLGRSWVPI